MPVYLTKEFLNDFRETEDARFVRQVLNHCVEQDGSFRPDKDDHRYHGIEDAWIRYVSRGKTAYRVIFIRKGTDVFLYRAGGHAFEDRLPPPATLAGALQVAGSFQVRTSPSAQPPTPQNAMAGGCLLKTTEADFISRHIESMYHLKHKEIYIVSPFIDLPLLESRHGFGRFLDRAVEEDTVVVLVTSSEQQEDRLPAYKNLEERGINVYFLSRLHTKLYLFDVDLAARNVWQQGVYSHAIVGSSNLTYPGLGFDDTKPNEELNCRLPYEMFEEAQRYVTRLTMIADDYKKYEFNIGSRRP